MTSTAGPHDLTVMVDYQQFYLWDAGSSPQAPTDYDEVDCARMVKIAPHVLVVQPARNDKVPVSVEVHVARPDLDLAGADHVVEATIDLATGALQVHECLGGAVLELSVPSDVYLATVRFYGLGTLGEKGLDGEDRYVIDLWPSPPAPLRVVRQWDPAPG
ncbi:MAG: hypothetical protein O2816_09140 [Planctomycetota bacterium]|nr:hypothetical protein [Planctomycetota bacterium]